MRTVKYPDDLDAVLEWAVKDQMPGGRLQEKYSGACEDVNSR